MNSESVSAEEADQKRRARADPDPSSAGAALDSADLARKPTGWNRGGDVDIEIELEEDSTYGVGSAQGHS